MRESPPTDRDVSSGMAAEAGESGSATAQRVTAGPLRLARTAIAGALMGIANLIPGVSGGTMVLAMGLYQEFIDSVADVTAFRWGWRRVVFLGVLLCFAGGAIVGLAGLILYLLFHFPVAMYALFIGLTLGGAPTLVRSLRPIRADVVVATGVGLALMVGVVLLKHAQSEGFPHNMAMDVVSGVVGATTMVLPGVSGSYMLLVLDQYGRVIGAVKDFDLKIIVPVGIGAVVGVIGLAHLLKVLLHRVPRATVGVLLGILLGSVIGLWPFGREPDVKILERQTAGELVAFAEAWRIPGVAPSDDVEALAAQIHERWEARELRTYPGGAYVRAVLLVVTGFVTTMLLSRKQEGKKSAGAA